MAPASELVQVAQAGKEVDPGWYRIHRRLSIHVTALALRLGVHATTCSLGMIALAALGAVGVAAPGAWANALGFALCYAAFLLDKVDGEVARCRGEASARGVLLDRFHHRVVEPTFFVAVGVHEWHATGSALVLAAGFVTAQLANAIEETQQLPPFILYKRAREGAAVPGGPAPPVAPGLVAWARALKPLKGFRMLIVALPVFALAYAAGAWSGRPVPAWALEVAAVALGAYLLFQTAYYYHGRLDRELAQVAETLRRAKAAGAPPGQGDPTMPEAIPSAPRSPRPSRSRATRTALALAVLLPALAAPARAADYYVGGGGCSDAWPGTAGQPYCTIGAALAAHHDPGTVIHVRPGTYHEQVAVPASGTSSAPLVVRAEPEPGDPVVLDARGLSYGFAISGRAWVTVQGFHVTKAAIQGIVVDGGSDHVTLRGNTVDSCATNGIAVNAASNVDVDGNVCADNGDHGIVLAHGTTGATVERNECMRNARPAERAANGINLDGAPGNVVRWNNLHDNQDTGLQINSDTAGNLSLENVSWRNGDHGYDHLRAQNVVHIGDVAWGNYKDGFSFEGGASNNAMYDCIATDNGLTTNEFDLWVDDTSHVGFASNDNILWNSTAQPPVKWISTLYASVADYSAASGQDTRTLQADPRFADAGVGDFHLRAGSPAIDSGNSSIASWPALDFYGLARIDDPNTPNTGQGGVAYADRGALEFGSPLTGVGDLAGGADPPRVLPNPLAGPGRLRFDTARAGALAVHLYDLRGRRVRTFVDQAAAPAGAHDLAIDDRGDDGRPLVPGVYFVRVRSAGGVADTRLVVTR